MRDTEFKFQLLVGHLLTHTHTAAQVGHQLLNTFLREAPVPCDAWDWGVPSLTSPCLLTWLLPPPSTHPPQLGSQSLPSLRSHHPVGSIHCPTEHLAGAPELLPNLTFSSFYVLPAQWKTPGLGCQDPSLPPPVLVLPGLSALPSLAPMWKQAVRPGLF